ncbi:hypothetical protein ACLOJK_019793 [Asimina triloba]
MSVGCRWIEESSLSSDKDKGLIIELSSALLILQKAWIAFGAKSNGLELASPLAARKQSDDLISTWKSRDSRRNRQVCMDQNGLSKPLKILSCRDSFPGGSHLMNGLDLSNALLLSGWMYGIGIHVSWQDYLRNRSIPDQVLGIFAEAFAFLSLFKREIHPIIPLSLLYVHHACMRMQAEHLIGRVKAVGLVFNITGGTVKTRS